MQKEIQRKILLFLLPIFLYESLTLYAFFIPSPQYALAQLLPETTVEENKSAEEQAQSLNTMLLFSQIPPKKIISIVRKNLEEEAKGDPYEDTNGNGQWDPGEEFTTSSRGTCECISSTTDSGEEICVPSVNSCATGSEPICPLSPPCNSDSNSCSCHKKPLSIDFLKAITDEKLAEKIPEAMSDALSRAEANINLNLDPNYIKGLAEEKIGEAVDATLQRYFNSKWICPDSVPKNTLQDAYHCSISPISTPTTTIWVCPPMTSLENDGCTATQTPPLARIFSGLGATTWYCPSPVTVQSIISSTSDCSLVGTTWTCGIATSLKTLGCERSTEISWHCPPSANLEEIPSGCSLSQSQWACPLSASPIMSEKGCASSSLRDFIPGGCNAVTNDLIGGLKDILNSQIKQMLPAWSLWFTENLEDILPTSAQKFLNQSLLANISKGAYDLMQGDIYNLIRTGIRSLGSEDIYNTFYKPLIYQLSENQQEALNLFDSYLQGDNFYNWIEEQTNALIATTVNKIMDSIEDTVKGWLGTSTPWILLDILFEDISSVLTDYIAEYWVDPIMYNIFEPIWTQVSPARNFLHYTFQHYFYNNLFDIISLKKMFCPPGTNPELCKSPTADFFDKKVEDFIYQLIASSSAGTGTAGIFRSLVSSSTLDSIDTFLQSLGMATDTLKTALAHDVIENLKTLAENNGWTDFAGILSSTEDLLNAKVIDILQRYLMGGFGFDLRATLDKKVRDLLPKGIQEFLEKQMWNDLFHGSYCNYMTSKDLGIYELSSEKTREEAFVTGTKACKYTDFPNNNPRYYFMEGFPKAYATLTTPIINFFDISTKETLKRTAAEWLVKWKVASTSSDFDKSFLKILNDSLAPSASGLPGVLSQKLNTLQTLNLVRKLEDWTTSTTGTQSLKKLLRLSFWELGGQAATTVVSEALQNLGVTSTDADKKADEIWRNYNTGGIKSVLNYLVFGPIKESLPTSTKEALDFVHEWVFDHFLFSNSRDLISHISYKTTKLSKDKGELRETLPSEDSNASSLGIFEESIKSILDKETPTLTPEWLSKTPLQILSELSETTTLNNATSIMSSSLIQGLASAAKGCLSSSESDISDEKAIEEVFGIDPTDINLEDIAKTPLFYLFPYKCHAEFTAPCVTSTSPHGHKECPTFTISPRSVILTIMAFVQRYTNENRPWLLNDVLLLNKSLLELLPDSVTHILTTQIDNLLFNELINFTWVTGPTGTKVYLHPSSTLLKIDWLISSTSAPTSSPTTTKTLTAYQLLNESFWDMLPQKAKNALESTILTSSTTLPCWFNKPLPNCLSSEIKYILTTPLNEFLDETIRENFPQKSIVDFFCSYTPFRLATSSSSFTYLYPGSMREWAISENKLEATTSFTHLSASLNSSCSFQNCATSSVSTFSCNISSPSCASSFGYTVTSTPLKRTASQFCENFLEKPLNKTFPFLEYSLLNLFDDLLNAANKLFLGKETNIHFERQDDTLGISLLGLFETEFPILGVFLDTKFKNYLSPSDKAFLDAKLEDFLPFGEILNATTVELIPCLLPSKVQEWADLGVNNLISNTTIGWEPKDKRDYFDSCWATITDVFTQNFLNPVMDTIAETIGNTIVGQWGSQVFNSVVNAIADMAAFEANNTTTQERINSALQKSFQQIQTEISTSVQETIKRGIMKNKLEPLERFLP